VTIIANLVLGKTPV